MYCDKDSNGRVSIMDLTSDEFDTIRRAIMAFKTGSSKIAYRPDSPLKVKPTNNITAQG